MVTLKVLNCTTCPEEVYEDDRDENTPKDFIECINCGSLYPKENLHTVSVPEITFQGEITTEEIPLIEE